MAELIDTLDAYLWSLAALGLAVLAGLAVHLVVFVPLRRLARRSASPVVQRLPGRLSAPLWPLLPLLALRLSLPAQSANLPGPLLDYLATALSTLIILNAAWVLIRLTGVLEDWVAARFDIHTPDNLAARKVLTQTDIVRKMLIFAICVFALAAVLMNFDNFRQIGTGLLASAGLAGLVLGFAAQRTLANLLAGFQIALSQPIRIDDVVIVENEWGRIEEITLTYVVVAIWDKRRLVLPISYFIDTPFQNWTRTSADILGTVFLYADYTLPIEAVRQQLEVILRESDYWDGQVCRLHTTAAGERSVELRALMSAASSGDAWELRCEVREKLIDYLQKHYPQCLPRVRAELPPADTGQAH